MSWIVVKSSHFRPAVIRLLQLQTADESKSLYGNLSPTLPQAAGHFHVWLAAILLLIAWQSAEVSSSFSSFLNSPAWIVPHVAWDSLFALVAWFTARASLERASQQVTSEFLTRILAPVWLTVLSVLLSPRSLHLVEGNPRLLSRPGRLDIPSQPDCVATVPPAWSLRVHELQRDGQRSALGPALAASDLHPVAVTLRLRRGQLASATTATQHF